MGNRGALFMSALEHISVLIYDGRDINICRQKEQNMASKKTGNPVGRPTDYRPEYCQQIIDYMAEGYSATAFAGSIRVSRSTITEWVDNFPEFSAAFKTGKAACAAWWEKTNRANAMAGTGNAASCIFGLKNMAPDEWREKMETAITGAGGGAIQNKLTIEFVNSPNNGED